MRRALLSATVAISFAAPAGAAANTYRSPAARPATDAYTFPEQCTVLPVKGKPFVKARGELAGLGCRVARRVETSSVRKNTVIGVVGGERSYAFGHTVTLIVSSGSV